MFINKINVGSKQVFKGYEHEINDRGEHALRFNYVYDTDKYNAKVEFYETKDDPKAYAGAKISKPIKTVDLQPNGTLITAKDLGIEPNGKFAYKISLYDKNNNYVTSVKDSGLQIEGGNLVSLKPTAPLVRGAGYFTIPDSEAPGVKYAGFESENPLAIVKDENLVKEAQRAKRTFSSRLGGNLAGLEIAAETLPEQYAYLFTTPLTAGAGYHGYWTEMQNQISPALGNIDNFQTYVEKLFQNGRQHVFDGTFTSEGLQGIHLQYALRWANQEEKPYSYYYFNMRGLKDNPIGFGVIPKYAENLTHRVINSPLSKDYDPKKETYFQIYDKSQVGEETAKLEDELTLYHDLKSGNELSINTHNDTPVSYIFEVNPKEYRRQVEALKTFNKESGQNIDEKSPEGTKFIAQFSNFRLNVKTEGGINTWDGQTDMAKFNNRISSDIEMQLQSIKDPEARAAERAKYIRANKELLDMHKQTAKYFTGKYKDIITSYVARTIGTVDTLEGVNKLLPKKVQLTQAKLSNILDGWYELSAKGELDRDEVTINALTKEPLDRLELGANTVGVLSSPYFTNRLSSQEDEFKGVNSKVNGFFSGQIKEFADKVIEKINENSEEKLLDENGNYTEYGEYIVDLIGADIQKYALLKALMGNSLKSKVLDDGRILYDYADIRKNTTLKLLGINAHNPQDEAAQLAHLIEKGLKNLDLSDVDKLADAFVDRYKGTNVNSFRIAEVVAASGLGMSWRLDAAKDAVEMDPIRDRMMDFDDSFKAVTDFWSEITAAIKSENSHSNILAEFTDFHPLLSSSFGSDLGGEFYPAEGNKGIKELNKSKTFTTIADTMAKVYTETGIVSEAAYSYFFSELIHLFANDFESGKKVGGPYEFKKKFDIITKELPVDVVRNLFTFVGNHDKTRTVHALALDMALYNTDMAADKGARELAVKIISAAENFESAPEEMKSKVNQVEYFHNVNTGALAVAKRITQILDNQMRGVQNRQLLKEALADLVCGNYLGEGPKTGLSTGIDDLHTANRKGMVGAIDFEQLIGMLIKQAEFKAGHKLENSEEILVGLYKNMTEEPVNTLAKFMAFLAALPGIATLYYGDEYGQTGYETHKNLWHTNRGAKAIPDGPLKEIKEQYAEKIHNATSLISQEGVEGLNNGTFYKLEPSNGEYAASLMQDGQGNMTVSVFDLAKDVDGDREFDSIGFVNGISLPEGTIFENINNIDKEKYLVKAGRLIRESMWGNKFVFNNDTTKNGVMVLKHVAQKVAFKGYNRPQQPKVGEKLSIISK